MKIANPHDHLTLREFLSLLFLRKEPEPHNAFGDALRRARKLLKQQERQAA